MSPPTRKQSARNLVFICLVMALATSGITANAAEVRIGSGASVRLGSAWIDAGEGDIRIAGELFSGSAGVEVRHMVIEPSGTLNGESATIRVCGDWTNDGSFFSGTSSVAFIDGCGVTSSTIEGSNSFHLLSFETTSGKFIFLEAGQTQSVTSGLAMSGVRGDELVLRSTIEGSEATLELALSVYGSASYVDAADINAPGCLDSPSVGYDDGIACTIDSCIEPGGISHVPDDLLCDDGDPCTADSCDEFSGCSSTPILGCDPADACSTYRWRFDEPSASAPDGTNFVDELCGEVAVVRDAGAVSTGTSLALPGGGSGSGAAYVDLPNGIISSLEDMTFEAWYTTEGGQDWSRLFDFGVSSGDEIPPGPGGTGVDYFFCSVNNVHSLRTEISTAGGFLRQDIPLTTALGQTYHLAVTFEQDGAGPGQSLVTTYRDGVQIAQSTVSATLADIDDRNNWIGRSNSLSDGFFNGTIEDLRLYDVALTPNAVEQSYIDGPDADMAPPPAVPFLNLLGAGLLGVLLGVAGLRRFRA